MFWRVLRFESRLALKRRSTWGFAFVYAELAFLFVNASGGAFSAIQMDLDSKELLNGPAAVAGWVGLFFLFGLPAVAAIIGGTGARDFEERMDALVFTTSVSKPAYLAGRFLGAFVVTLGVIAVMPAALAIGAEMPYLDRARFGPFQLGAYARAFAVFVIPNVILAGTLFFGAAVLLRRGIANQIGAIVLLVGYFVALGLASDLETRRLAALLDPFGLIALDAATRYWSVVERNTMPIPLDGILGVNRAIWLAAAAAMWAGLFLRFRIAWDVPGRKRSAEVRHDLASAPAAALPRVEQRFTARGMWHRLWRLAWRDLVELVHTRSFTVVVVSGLILLLVLAPQVTKIFGTPTYPVTHTILDVMGGIWSLFLVLAITIYAGELVWRDRELRADRVLDALPVPAGVRYGAKLVALLVVVALLLLIVLVGGIATQAAQGYYRFELPLYFGQLGLRFVHAALIAVLALTVHVLVNHKYFGHGAVLVLVVGMGFLPELGLEHRLFRYASDSGWHYSDLNGYGDALGPVAVWMLYWGAVAFLLAIGAVALWARGHETTWKARRAAARRRFGPGMRRLTAGGVTACLGLGGWIYYNTNILNRFMPTSVEERRAAAYERTYRRFKDAPQPRIVAVSVRADLYPEKRSVTFRGRTTLKNMTGAPLDSVHVLLPSSTQLDMRRLALARPARLVLEDDDWQYRIFHLIHPLEPGDSTELEFELVYRPHGFRHTWSPAGVVSNGTFLSNDLLPSIGYDDGDELSNPKTRRRLGLPPKRDGMPDLFDTTARRNSFLAHDADWIRFEATVSTSEDQIAVAPGRLAREWREGGRRVFHYVQDAPMLNFYSFQSGRYAVWRDQWEDVAIEVLYHPAHDFNVPRIAEAAKKSLAYFSRTFGPYPHRVLRIVEFPRYSSSAQAFATTIPFSESIGFLARVDAGAELDYPFYVIAHEVAHQWWGHQVVGGAVQGAAMLSESMAQYSAFMLAEEEFGRDEMHRFLRYELDRYLSARGGGGQTEPPLYRVESEQHVFYNKGSLATYALRDLLGKEAVNAAFARFAAATRFQAPPYTYTPELLDTLRAIVPDSLSYLIGDLFERIVLYNNRAVSAVARPAGAGRYEVALTIETEKVYADSVGVETPAPMDDLVDIGVYGRTPAGGAADTTALYLRKHRIGAGTRQITITVDGEPVTAGVDPEHKLIDRNPGDNVVEVKPPEAEARSPQAAGSS